MQTPTLQGYIYICTYVSSSQTKPCTIYIYRHEHLTPVPRSSRGNNLRARIPICTYVHHIHSITLVRTYVHGSRHARTHLCTLFLHTYLVPQRLPAPLNSGCHKAWRFHRGLASHQQEDETLALACVCMCRGYICVCRLFTRVCVCTYIHMYIYTYIP